MPGVGNRISPACAGNTELPATRRHPGPGSAPRARGTRRVLNVAIDELRISPACAGNTATNYARRRRAYGSAPRARGTHAPVGSSPRQRRISPACAGNTCPELDRRAARHAGPAQPRVRGEHLLFRHLFGPCGLPGSAPRARGTRSHPDVGSPSPHPDQPRVRGEHGEVDDGEGWITGSAPRARGTPCDWYRGLDIGSTDGSAPRARGTPTIARLFAGSFRISPACAGNTSPTATI